MLVLGWKYCNYESLAASTWLFHPRITIESTINSCANAGKGHQVVSLLNVIQGASFWRLSLNWFWRRHMWPPEFFIGDTGYIQQRPRKVIFLQFAMQVGRKRSFHAIQNGLPIDRLRHLKLWSNPWGSWGNQSEEKGGIPSLYWCGHVMFVFGEQVDSFMKRGNDWILFCTMTIFDIQWQ